MRFHQWLFSLEGSIANSKIAIKSNDLQSPTHVWFLQMLETTGVTFKVKMSSGRILELLHSKGDVFKKCWKALKI